MRPLSQLLVSRYSRYIGFVTGALVVVTLAFAILSPGFLSTDNLLNLAWAATPLAIIAIGQTLVVLGGGADLSVGSLVALCSIVTVGLLDAGASIPVAVFGGLGVGLACGTVNGALAVSLGIPSFVITFATLAIYRGLAFVVAQRAFGGLTSLAITDPNFVFLGRGEWLERVPPSLVIMLCLAIAGSVVLTQTRVGLSLRAVGGNDAVARAAGIRPHLFSVTTFAVSGMLAALAGILLAAGNFGVSPGTTGTTLEFQSLAVVILGGTRLGGGEGGIGGTLLAVAFLTVLISGVSHLGLDPRHLPTVQGSVLLLIIGVEGFLGLRRQARFGTVRVR